MIAADTDMPPVEKDSHFRGSGPLCGSSFRLKLSQLLTYRVLDHSRVVDAKFFIELLPTVLFTIRKAPVYLLLLTGAAADVETCV